MYKNYIANSQPFDCVIFVIRQIFSVYYRSFYTKIIIFSVRSSVRTNGMARTARSDAAVSVEFVILWTVSVPVRQDGPALGVKTGRAKGITLIEHSTSPPPLQLWIYIEDKGLDLSRRVRALRSGYK